MKKPPTISVVILTHNRPILLKKALASIARQTVKPIEVIVVGDPPDISPETRSVINSVTTVRPILKRNAKRTISYGRDIGQKSAIGDIVVYLDDDCEASPTYLSKFRSHFATSPDLSAVMGRIINANPKNVYATTQFSYYDRGLKQFFPTMKSAQPVLWGRILDCEVMAIRKRDIQSIGFPDRYRGYRNDDVDLGLRLIAEKKKILFDPTIIARSHPRTNLPALLTAAFWNGHSDADTSREYGVNLRWSPHPVWFPVWYRMNVTTSPFLGLNRLKYGALLLLFPAVSRLGGLYFHIRNL